jgi:hypothetical protein
MACSRSGWVYQQLITLKRLELSGCNHDASPTHENKVVYKKKKKKKKKKCSYVVVWRGRITADHLLYIQDMSTLEMCVYF